MANRIWQTDIQDWTKLTKDIVLFYLTQAESNLKSCLELSDRITTRAFSLLTIIIPIITLTLGYLLKQIIEGNANYWLLLISITCLIISFVCLYFLVKLIFPRGWMPLGRQPNEIFTSHMVDNDLDQDKKYIAIVMGEIECIQTKIDYNKLQNNKRLKYLKIVLVLISTAFVIVMIFLLRQLYFTILS